MCIKLKIYFTIKLRQKRGEKKKVITIVEFNFFY